VSRPKLDWSPSPSWDPNRPTRAKEHTPAATAGRPPVPRHLTAEEKQRFRQLCRELEAMGCLSKGLGELVTLYCVTWSRWRKAMADVEARGEVIISVSKGKDGELIEREKKNPWLLISQESEKQMYALLDRLGLSPMNQSRVKPVKRDVTKEEFPVGSAGWIIAQSKLNEENNAN
jgi:P27 family predicted phage terminase small subunit